MKKVTIILGVIILILIIAIIYGGVYLVRSGDDKQTDLPFEFGDKVTVEGELVCLPHRDQTGPQTLECALGLKKNADTYYGIKNTGDAFGVGGFTTGDRVSVTGTALERDPEGRYGVVAVIDVESMREIGKVGDQNMSSIEWEPYTHQDPVFSISYPEMWKVKQESPFGWSNLSGMDGENLFTATTPDGYLDGTNFRNAQVTVGWSTNPRAVVSCTELPENRSPETTIDQVTINGVNFAKIHFVGAAAGGRYDTTSYRTKHDGACYAVESVLSYSAMGMYGEDSDVGEFDHRKVENILKKTVATFSF